MATEVVRPYEGIVIVHPDASEAEVKQLITKNKSIIEEYKGAINHVDSWGKRNLSNPIEKQRRGQYLHFTFKINNSGIAELERTMRINDKVLRFMHISLGDSTDLGKYVEQFKKELAESLAKEKDREQKFAAKRAARSPGPSSGMYS